MKGLKKERKSGKKSMVETILCLQRRGVHYCCAGFGWDNFLPSSWCGTVFWICAANSVDNTGMLCHDFPTYHQESPGACQQENLVVS